MVEAAKSEKLKEVFRHHLKETKDQLKRLEEIGLEINEELHGQECLTMAALLKEGQKIMQTKYDNDVRDAALISAAQCVEHYEIVCWHSEGLCETL